MRSLRIARRRVALLAAVAELAGSWSLEQPDDGAEPLCRSGDRRRAAPSAARGGARAARLRSADPADPEQGSGLIVLGMGKLGGGS